VGRREEIRVVFAPSIYTGVEALVNDDTLANET
jgi:hypothetical protein